MLPASILSRFIDSIPSPVGAEACGLFRLWDAGLSRLTLLVQLTELL